MFVAILDNIRSAYNVGSILRTADCAGIDAVVMAGCTAYPPHPKLPKTSLGAERSVPWLYVEDAFRFMANCRAGEFEPEARCDWCDISGWDWASFKVAAFEIAPRAMDLFAYQWPLNVLGVFGNEVGGVNADLLEAADQIVQIPMWGKKASLNVASSFAVAAYEYRRVKMGKYPPAPPLQRG